MKKLLLLIALIGIFAASNTIYAQYGFGTNQPNASALIDMTATNMGLLIPRMTANDRSIIASPATGLIVYQTDAPAGFYYFNGTVWVRITDGATPIWHDATLTGDGTTTAIGIALTNPNQWTGLQTFEPGLAIEGATADDYEIMLGAIDPTADRYINFPNAEGTVMVTEGTWTAGNTTNNRDNYIPIWSSADTAFINSNIQMGSNGHFVNFMDSELTGAGSTSRVEIGAVAGTGTQTDPYGSATGYVVVNGRGTWGSTGKAVAGMTVGANDATGALWVSDASDATEPIRGIMGFSGATTGWISSLGDASTTGNDVTSYWISDAAYGLLVGSNFTVDQAGNVKIAGALNDGTNNGTDGQVLISTGTSVQWGNVSAGALTLTNGKIFIGNSSNVAAEQTMSGDVLIDNIGVATIQDGAVATSNIIESSTAYDVLLTPSPAADPVWGKITANNMTAGDYDAVITSGDYSINITGNAATATLATTATTANALANTDAAGQSAITAINSATTGTIGLLRLDPDVISATELGAWTGSSSITTVGTIANGTWQGSVIQPTYLPTTIVYDGDAASGDLAGTYPGPTIATSAGNSIVTAINDVATTNTIAVDNLTAGTAGYLLTSVGSPAIPTWTDPATIAIGTATDLAGGLAGSVPYQDAASSTTFLGIGTAGQFMQVNSVPDAPQWSTMSGDASIAVGGALTLNNKVTMTATSPVAVSGSPTVIASGAVAISIADAAADGATKGAAAFVAADFEATAGVISIDAAIARDAEVTTAISALSTVYQPLDADLTSIAGIESEAANQILYATNTNTWSIIAAPTDGTVLNYTTSGGLAWVAPSTLTVTETDPQVGTNTTDYVPVWNGSALVTSIIGATGTTASVNGILTVSGTSTLTGNVDAQAGLDVTGADLTVGSTMFTVDDATGNTSILGDLTDGTLADANPLVIADNLTVSGSAVTLSALPAATDATVVTVSSSGVLGKRDLSSEAIRYQNTTGTLNATDGIVLVANTTGVTITLPSAVTVGAGKKISVKKANNDGSNITIASAGGTIDGQANWNMNALWMGYTFVSDGANWFIIQRF